MSAFEEFGICPELITSCEENEWNIPTAVQAEAMPLILTGGDVLVASETGSGKTGAFGLPVLQIVHEVLVERAKNEVVRGNHDVAGAVTKQTANKQKKVTKTNNEGKNKIPRLSSTDRNALFAIDEETSNGLKAESRAKHSWAGARCTTGYCASANNKKHTKVAYECSVLDDGLVRLGFSFLNASLDGLGTDASSWGYGGTGKKSHNKKFEDYGTKFGKGDVVTCMLNLETMGISYALNGKEFPKQSAVAFKLKKSSKAGDDVYFPAVCVKDAEVEMNFGSSPFKFPEVLKRNGFISCAECEEQNIKSFEEASQNNNSNASKGNGSTASKKPLAIILEPVRDLAEQTQEVLISFKKYLINPEIECALFTGGGVDEKKQRKWLAEGCDIITGTPSKIVDHVEKRLIDVSNVKFFILDEADRLVSMGNQSMILKLAEQLQKFNGNEVGIDRLQTLMFSATLHSPEITRLATKLCVNPTWVDLKGRDAVIPDSVHHACVRIDPANHDENENTSSLKEFVSTDGVHAFDSNSNDAKLKLSEAVKMLKPCVLKELIDTHSITKCMIFFRTNFDCDNLANFLNKCGFDKAANVQTSAYSCAVLGGAKSMDERRTNLSAFKSGEIKFLICTDVAARGLDISGLPFVINMTLPDRSEDYVHRIGRVGRADSM
jgi:ATP-dependent RNA helicase DDX1